jgi:hypothetical protein
VRPRAAAIRNKIRIAENAFIYLMQVKKKRLGTLYITNFFELLYGAEEFLSS